jgi:YfiH family protein
MPSPSHPPRTPKRNPTAVPSPSGPAPSDGASQRLHEIDTQFQRAGLTRHRRNRPFAVARPAKFQEKTPDELRPSLPQLRIAPNGVEWIPAPGWDKLTWLRHGFSTRRSGLTRAYAAEDAPGELNLGFTPEDPRETVAANRRLLVEAITGNADTPLITIRQIHSSVLIIAGPSTEDRKWKADGLITNHPGILLGVQTADCTPVLVADRRLRVVAAIHAGWRGTVQRIVEKGIGRMRLEFGSRPGDLTAAIGPGIGPCCYQVGEEVLSAFESQFHYSRELFHEVYSTDPVRKRYPMLFLTQRAPGHSNLGPGLHLDVAEANRRQLLAAGVKPRSIHLAGGCTSCHRELFFSHRASQGRAGRMLSVIGIRP